ncbi:hypothetical protein [Micromonospora fulviviridis]|uniref:Uncharacterized protein n=1 Tax=Micromonospora fulviviridis TaxID=47860 RepID=A0ABV2VVL2_9ACTN
MLTYRLISTTEHSGSTTTNPTTIRPNTAGPQPATGAESSRTMVRLEDGAALLTCDDTARRADEFWKEFRKELWNGLRNGLWKR